MTEISSNVRVHFLTAVAIFALAPLGANAQNAPAVPLTLGEAARLAARQSAIAQGARLRADEAEARVRERRADLLPNVTSYANQSGHTLNSATFGISFPAPPGEKPFFDPAGEVIGPINLVDVRG